MGSKPKWKPRRTLIDLYNERDHTPWYWRAAAIVSAGAVMMGYALALPDFKFAKLMFYSYLVFPSAFKNNPDLTVRPVNATVIASILLAIGYSTSVALWFTCHSSLFRLDSILA
jgi:hypothetical protein